MNATAVMRVSESPALSGALVAVDLTKNVFQLAVADGAWRLRESHRLSRLQFEHFFLANSKNFHESTSRRLSARACDAQKRRLGDQQEACLPALLQGLQLRMKTKRRKRISLPRGHVPGAHSALGVPAPTLIAAPMPSSQVASCSWLSSRQARSTTPRARAPGSGAHAQARAGRGQAHGPTREDETGASVMPWARARR